MPDIVSPRPVAGEAIASAWGQEVHDGIEGIQAALASGITGNNVTSFDMTVTFPRPYATPPVVVATIAMGTVYWIVMAHTVTATDFKLTFTRKDNAAVTAIGVSAHWIAIGTLAA